MTVSPACGARTELSVSVVLLSVSLTLAPASGGAMLITATLDASGTELDDTDCKSGDDPACDGERGEPGHESLSSEDKVGELASSGELEGVETGEESSDGDEDMDSCVDSTSAL